LTEALREGLRGEDAILRYGGDEFVCVLPDMSVRQARQKLSDIQVEAAKAGVRFCMGVAQLQRKDDVVSLFARADRELYDFKAKRGEIVQLPTVSSRKDGKRSDTG
jgi:diguanylate cyclase (GGDEF)-like protein